ncbi:MAG: hypothetical protein HQL27_04010 [Candidatus Omnitrophica bacterium]|nr:hypothetical protein [Candidatus Omnitrophota bacterium]
MKNKYYIKKLAKHEKDRLIICSVLIVLDRIRKQLGLEAMLIFMKKYIVSFERSDKEIKGIIDEIIGKVDIEGMYEGKNIEYFE